MTQTNPKKGLIEKKTQNVFSCLMNSWEWIFSIAQDSNNTFSSVPETLNSTASVTSPSNLQPINQQPIDESPITTQINKMMKKNKKDLEKKMLLDEDL